MKKFVIIICIIVLAFISLGLVYYFSVLNSSTAETVVVEEKKRNIYYFTLDRSLHNYDFEDFLYIDKKTCGVGDTINYKLDIPYDYDFVSIVYLKEENYMLANDIDKSVEIISTYTEKGSFVVSEDMFVGSKIIICLIVNYKG